ncbi:MAG: hypothetical protein NWE77_04290, partial [Candidatus Bathyarchaeota archaeon]|nr:hypothetical protein [Candidatus Bathyarchaeota archaeon]
SMRRRQVNQGYKEGRKPIRLNRDVRNLTEDQELENKVWQQMRLVEYLNEMPISQIMIPAIEADDVISLITQLPTLKGWQKVIVSSDKDFFQLCDDETVLLRPIQKEVLNKNMILEKHGIHPTNFALARAIAGDKSDNLPGVPGAGLKTVAKRLPFLSEEKSYTIDEVVDFCKNTESKLKAFKSIVEHADVVRENYQIMQLYSPSMSPQAKRQVKVAINDLDPEFNKTGIVKMMHEDGFGVYDWSDLFVAMKRIVSFPIDKE